MVLLEHPVLTNFVYPFLLMFFIVFAILEKTQVLGDKKQINALVAFVIGLIFVTAVFPKQVVDQLILFLTIGIVIMFVVYLLWGFISPGEKGTPNIPKGLKNTLLVIVGLAVLVAVLSATGALNSLSGLFNEPWSEAFWTNFFFILLIAAALAVALLSGKGGGKSE